MPIPDQLARARGYLRMFALELGAYDLDEVAAHLVMGRGAPTMPVAIHLKASRLDSLWNRTLYSAELEIPVHELDFISIDLTTFVRMQVEILITKIPGTITRQESP